MGRAPKGVVCSPSRVKRYKGIREPRCQGGDGCPACWVKYRKAQRYTRDELKWAKRIGKKIGIDDPKLLLSMRWSEFNALAASFGLQPAFLPRQPGSAPAP